MCNHFGLHSTGFLPVLLPDASAPIVVKNESVNELNFLWPKMAGLGAPFSGTEKVPQRTCVTKILPNLWVNFLVRFASKPLVLLGSALESFRKFFGTVRAIFFALGFFSAPRLFDPKIPPKKFNVGRYLSSPKLASQNRSDHGGCKWARNHSAAEIAGFSTSPAAKK